MKKVLAWMSTIALVLCFAFSAQAQFKSLGGDVPFPWGTELPFPWDNIDGIWVAQDGFNEFYFNIKVVNKDPSGSHVVNMVQYDPVTMDVLSRGGGFAYSYDKILRVAMNNSDTDNYLSIIRAYEYVRDDVKDVATVMTIRFFENSKQEDLHFILRKVSDVPLIFPGQ